jgi:hypothetical protein
MSHKKGDKEHKINNEHKTHKGKHEKEIIHHKGIHNRQYF